MTTDMPLSQQPTGFFAAGGLLFSGYITSYITTQCQFRNRLFFWAADGFCFWVSVATRNLSFSDL